MIWKLWRVITFFLHRYYHALQYIASVSAGWPNIPIFQRLCLNRMQPLTWHSGKCESKSLLGKLSHIWTSNYPLGASRLKSVDEAEEKHRSQVTTRDATFWFLCLLWRTLANFGVVFSQICCKEDWPQVLQKNIGVFSLRSQLAQEGNSSEEDSTWWRDNWNCNPLEDLPVRFTKRFPSRVLRRKLGF